MSDARTVAAACGIAVELADLGDWGATTLISEYDPRTRIIRINVRALADHLGTCGERTPSDARAFIDLAIEHELYHHREATGEVVRRVNRLQREQAADAYARANVPIDARLDAFLTSEMTP